MSSLQRAVASTSIRATQNGALITMPTERVVVTDGGIPFVVHITELQNRKTAAAGAAASRRPNPFLPPDPELVIGEVGPGHLAVLNKFNVIPDHVLIVTRRFVSQDRLLDSDDVRALAACMDDLDGLGFYNGGTTAGASQPHRHLQLVPVPLGFGPAPTPIDEILRDLPAPGRATRIDALDFPHVVLPLSGRRIAARDAEPLFDIYRLGCDTLGITDGRPYNLLVTRRWMLLVPRSRELWRRISVNALGFAGSLLVHDRAELESVISAGPLSILRSVVTDGAQP